MRGLLLITALVAGLITAESVQAQIPNYDLSVTDVQAPQEILAGQRITVTAKIHSSGTQSASVHWSVYLTINGALQGAIRVADFGPVELAAGTVLNVQEQLNLPTNVTGRHRLAVVVDADNLIAERNEYDNTGIASDFTRIRTLAPDLSVSPVSLDSNRSQANQSINVRFRVDNLGSVAATFDVAGFVSRNVSVSTDDTEVGRARISLAPGQSSHEVMMLTLPNDLTAGDYRVAIIADPDSNVTEVQTANNIGLATQILNISSDVLQIHTQDLPGGTVFIDYYARVVAQGGDGHFRMSVEQGRLPRGLQLNTATGEITGTPLESGTLDITVRVTSAGLSVQKEFSMIMAPSGIDLVITTPSLGIGTISLPFQIELTAAGGEPPYTWRLYDGALPQGIDLNSSGWLSGIPRVEGKYTVSLEVEDGLGAKDMAEFEFPIQAPNVTVTTESIPDILLNQPTSFTLQASGGKPPYVWTAKSRLPAGLSLTEEGVLSGEPSQIGTHPFRVQVVDSSQAGGGDTALFHLKVLNEGVFRIIQTPVTPLLTREKLSYVLRTEGGLGTLKWKLEPGDRLPDGFELVPSETAPDREVVLLGSSFRPLTHGFGIQVEDETGRVRKSALVIQVDSPELSNIDGCRCLQSRNSDTGYGLLFLAGLALFGFRRASRQS